MADHLGIPTARIRFGDAEEPAKPEQADDDGEDLVMRSKRSPQRHEIDPYGGDVEEPVVADEPQQIEEPEYVQPEIQ